MSTLIKITAGAAVVAAGLGNLLAAAPAQADAQQDQGFYWLLTRPDGDNLTITNFPLVRAQGIAACQRQDAGEPPYQTLKELQYPRGPGCVHQGGVRVGPDQRYRRVVAE
ncbi:DUF732 domain-containing protein [Mycolicibacterium aubagnense]|uniref:Secreted protein n=1 Tax=Mycolicibacterium aubagnense TaxID=319707 RepID=A0ABM7IBV8_9MYCO|nr:DUF732 domain-containing protein [Mycolicibacterium aubagnense]TLH57766.1 hypothetical protein C1S80_22005 [Mycolicibacterium aubagnense]BBX84169.1 hypothetical protein MAUB_20420 [Mycolicibacterium aubagnense]